MKDGKFETQADIYQALLDGKIITDSSGIVRIIDGRTHKIIDGFWREWFAAFSIPTDWSIYEEPKPNKKVTLYRHWYFSPEHNQIFTCDTTVRWQDMKDNGDKLLETEILCEKEFEV